MCTKDHKNNKQKSYRDIDSPEVATAVFDEDKDTNIAMEETVTGHEETKPTSPGF